jgi:hypothetical protein
MKEDKDMTNENENEDNKDKIETAEIDGGVVRMSAQGMEYESKDNEIMTAEYAWKTNREGLYRTLSSQINEKLNTAIQGLEYDSFAEPVVLYFSCSTLAHHFYNQLESHGWIATLDQDDDVVQVDVTRSIDKMSKDNQDDDDIGDGGLFSGDVLSLH